MGDWLTRNADCHFSGLLKHLLSLGYLQGEHTSVLVFDLEKLDRRLDELNDAFPPKTLHAVAIKANPLPAILRGIVERGFGLEAASRGAKEAGGTTIGIIPGSDHAEANPYVDIPICTGIG